MPEILKMKITRMKNETNTMATKNDNGATPRFSQRQ
ncbi:hypothetical protein EC991775_3160, partial [Escherichia coli 99.1775]